jgi:phage tail-like protein
MFRVEERQQGRDRQQRWYREHRKVGAQRDPPDQLLTPDSQGGLPEAELRRPPTELMQRIATHLDARRLVGTRLLVAPPEYHGITVVASPHPLGESLPALYADDSLAQRLCQGLDEVLAPVLATLDCLTAYLDPATAPIDLVEWLAGWVGVAVAPEMPDRRRRLLVAAAAQLYVWRGTPSAIRDIVELSTKRGSPP